MPHKHVNFVRATSDLDVLDTELLVVKAPWGDVPIVASTELNSIQFTYWSEDEGIWRPIAREHEALFTGGRGAEASNSWNWSRRVGLASLQNRAFLVCKRQNIEGTDGIALYVEQFDASDQNGNKRFRSAGTTLVNLNKYRILEIGFALWAGTLEDSGELLILVQARLASSRKRWSLVLIRGKADVADADQWTATIIGDGGYDLDARLDGTSIHTVYRVDPAGVRIATGGRGLQTDLNSRTNDVKSYSELTYTVYDLVANNAVSRRIAGGEHPRIQSISPLIITFERYQSGTCNIARNALLELTVTWRPASTCQMIYAERRGESFLGELWREPAVVIPRSHSVFTDPPEALNWVGDTLTVRTPIGFRPCYLLQLVEDEKSIKMDFLRHEQLRSLWRVRVDVSLSGGIASMQSFNFDIWDIGHEQISELDSDPGTFEENTQFLPFELVPAETRTRFLPRYRYDNTMGGALRTSHQVAPQTFFAYTDLGDGGLRVVFDPDIPPPGTPPFEKPPKQLLPELVTGPGSPNEKWIEIDAQTWTASALPSYRVGIEQSTPSRAAFVGDTLIRGVEAYNSLVALGGSPPPSLLAFVSDNTVELDLTRLTRRALTDFQHFLVNQEISTSADGAPGPDPRTAFRTLNLTSGDGSLAHILVQPARLVSELALNYRFHLGPPAPPGVAPVQVPGNPAWSLVPIEENAPEGAIPNFQDLDLPRGSEQNFEVNAPGLKRISVFVPDATGTEQGFFVDASYRESARQRLWQPYNDLSESPEYLMGVATLRLFNLETTFNPGRSSDTRETVGLRVTETHDTSYMFEGASDMSQGRVAYRSQVSLSTAELSFQGLATVAAALFKIEQLDVTIPYTRRFTPGVLMRDTRHADRLTGDEITPPVETIPLDDAQLRVAAIACKPIGDTVLEEPVTRVTIGPNWAGMGMILLVPILAGVLLLLGFPTLAAFLVAGVLNLVLLLVVLLLALTIVYVTVKPLLEAEITRRVNSVAGAPERKEAFDEMGMLTFAGEGLSEALARKLLENEANLDSPPFQLLSANSGIDRNRGQVFQIVVVTAGKCKALVRT